MTNTQNNQVRFTADTTSLKAETMTTTNIIALDRIASADETRCGGKAWNCARMKQAGFPVPDGLVVLATATPDELNQIRRHPWFDSLPAGTLFAVRSSGIGEDGSGQSFAGIHQTLLDVPRHEVAQAVASCQASAFSQQALEYRRKQGSSTDANEIAVLTQQRTHPEETG